MVNRVKVLGIEFVGFWGLALALSVHSIVLIAMLVSMAMALVPGLKPSVRFLGELILLAGVALETRNSLAIAILAATIATALTTARTPNPSPDRAILLGLMLSTTAAAIQSWTAWCLALVALLGVLALATSGETNPATQKTRSRLAATLVLSALGGALVLALILTLLPWRPIVATIFAIAAWPFIALLSRLTLPRLHARKHPLPRSPLRGQQHTHDIVPHIPVAVSAGLILAATLIVALILYFAYRYWSRPDEVMVDTTSESGILRETLTPEEGLAPLRWKRKPLTPVRQLVQSRLIRANRKKTPRTPAETFREWLARTEPSLSSHQVADIYEAIRYGSRADTVEQRNQIEKEWPKA